MIINSTKVVIPLTALTDPRLSDADKILYFKILECKAKIRQKVIPIEILAVDTGISDTEELAWLESNGYLKMRGDCVDVFDFKPLFNKKSYPGFFYFGKYSNGDMKIGISKNLIRRKRQLNNNSLGFRMVRAFYFHDFGAAIYCENQVKRLIKESGLGVSGTSESFKSVLLDPVMNLFDDLRKNLEHEEVDGNEWRKDVGYL